MKGTSGIQESLKQCDKQLKTLIFSDVVIQERSEKGSEVSFINEIFNVWG